MTVVEHAFFQSLSVTALWHTASDAERADFETRLAARMQALDTWAAHCPFNYAPLQLTVAAERARVHGDPTAGELYEQAIAAACASQFPHIEAIACELAMKHFHAREPVRADSLRLRAIAAYETWGSPRKANALRRSQ